MTTQSSSTPTDNRSFGRIGYDAYGNHPSAHGPWTTFDGRPMPKWDEYSSTGPGSSGAFTQERWEQAAVAIITEYERRRLQLEGEGRIDPFLLGLSEIASATRDLAEASKAVPVDTEPLEDLIEDVTKTLHSRVLALAPPTEEPAATA
ncbi:hypothetical protein ACN28E_25010 [Archangium lansingense]|uniref:hypothetical protein n=1 Tax=Archangium lansingense TaxID=2995310 RepID=UPI003B7D92DB